MDILTLLGKQVVITNHVMRRCIEREIAYPEQILILINTGKIKRFGKQHFRLVGNSLECVCVDDGEKIIIKTVVRK